MWSAMGQRGAASVEFAILIGPMLLLIFGVIEFGRFFWAANALEQIATRTVRCMGVRQASCSAGGAYSQSASLAFAKDLAQGYAITLPDSAVTLSNAGVCAGISGFSTATISYSFTTMVPKLIPALAARGPLTATACFPNQS